MRRTPMKRTPIRRAIPSSQPKPDDCHVERALVATKSVAMVTRRAVMAPSNDAVFAQPKENAIQHEGYMRLVRLLPCAMCGIEGYTQFCHADEGKGEKIKTDCRRGWPGCGPRVGLNGCHHFVGTSGTLEREAKRKLEAMLGAQTRAKIRSLGLWPASLPQWPGDSN